MRAAHRASAISKATAATAVIFVSVAAGAWAQTKESSERKTGTVDRGVAATTRKEQPPVSIRVTLSVYSGRPNPSWTVEPGPDLDRLVAQIQSLKPTDAKLFDYDEWNRLGYASWRAGFRGSRVRSMSGATWPSCRRRKGRECRRSVPRSSTRRS